MSIENVDPSLVNAIKAQILEELKDEDTKRRERLVADREQQRKAHAAYVAKMKESTDPWVEVLGFVETEQGVRIELEWNDAFVLYLREEGLTGTDDDAVVQRWITLLLRDMADKMDGTTDKSKSEYA